MGQRGKRFFRICEFHLSYYLNQLNAWINRKLVSGEVRNFWSVLSRENSTVANTLFWIFCFETVARKLDDVSNNRLEFADIPWIRFRLTTTSKNNFNEIHIPGQRLKIPSLSDYSPLVYLDDDGGDDDDVWCWWRWWWWLSLGEAWLDS